MEGGEAMEKDPGSPENVWIGDIIPAQTFKRRNNLPFLSLGFLFWCYLFLFCFGATVVLVSVTNSDS